MLLNVFEFYTLLPNLVQNLFIKKKCNVFSLNSKSLKLVDQFIYFGSNISFTESDANAGISKEWTAIDTMWKSDHYH